MGCRASKQERKQRLPEYNAYMSLNAILFSWKGTVLPLVLKKCSFWLLVLSHGVWVGLRENLDEIPSWLSAPEHEIVATGPRSNPGGACLLPLRLARRPTCCCTDRAAFIACCLLLGLLCGPVLPAVFHDVRPLRGHRRFHALLETAHPAPSV